MTIQLNEIKEISKELKEQDNCHIENPIWLLFEQEKVPTDSDYSDDYFYYDSDMQSELKNEQEVFDDLDNNGCFDDNLPFKNKLLECIENEDYETFQEELINEGYEQFNKIHYLWRSDFKQAFFTKKSAEAYLKENNHHFWNPLIICSSLYRNEEMKRIRNYLISEVKE